jgi:hypothetical protein
MVDGLAANVTGGLKARGREGVLQGGLLCPPFAFGGPRRLLLQQHVHAHGKTQYDGENKHKKQQHDALAPGVGWHVCTLRKAWYGSGRHQQRCHACATEHPDGEDEHGGNGSHQSASAVSAGHGVLGS